MANQLGKVYICGKCGSQVIVTKGGAGALKCCGAPMEQKSKTGRRRRTGERESSEAGSHWGMEPGGARRKG